MEAWLGSFVPGHTRCGNQELVAALGVAMKSVSVTEPLERAGFVVIGPTGSAWPVHSLLKRRITARSWSSPR